MKGRYKIRYRILNHSQYLVQIELLYEVQVFKRHIRVYMTFIFTDTKSVCHAMVLFAYTHSVSYPENPVYCTYSVKCCMKATKKVHYIVCLAMSDNWGKCNHIREQHWHVLVLPCNKTHFELKAKTKSRLKIFMDKDVTMIKQLCSSMCLFVDV